MPRRILAVTAIAAALCVVGCGSPPPPTTDPAPPSTSASAGSTAPASTATTGAADPTPGTVPVDQIPPGRPASWIPAGMPTAAPWKEPGDVLPMFTLTMFENSPGGAVAAALFYAHSRNWAIATLDPRPLRMICDSKTCEQSVDLLRAVSAAHGHVIGARQRYTSWRPLVAPSSSAARWVVRLSLVLEAGRSVDARGMTIKSQAASAETNDIYMRWSGRMWRVIDDVVAR